MLTDGLFPRVEKSGGTTKDDYWEPACNFVREIMSLNCPAAVPHVRKLDFIIPCSQSGKAFRDQRPSFFFWSSVSSMWFDTASVGNNGVINGIIFSVTSNLINYFPIVTAPLLRM